MTNSFNTLEDKNDQYDSNREKEEADNKYKQVEADKLSTKDWVNKSFGKSTEIQQGIQDLDQMNALTEKNEKKKKTQQREVYQK